MTYKSILGIVPIAMSLGVVKENLKGKGNIVKKGVKSIVGVSLIKGTANFLNL